MFVCICVCCEERVLELLSFCTYVLTSVPASTECLEVGTFVNICMV